MKKRFLVLTAAGGFSACQFAMAQTSVTLYGIIDESIQYTHNTGGQSNQIKLQTGQMSISQWGLKGTEDLGNGMSALFQACNRGKRGVAVDVHTDAGRGILHRPVE